MNIEELKLLHHLARNLCRCSQKSQWQTSPPLPFLFGPSFWLLVHSCLHEYCTARCHDRLGSECTSRVAFARQFQPRNSPLLPGSPHQYRPFERRSRLPVKILINHSNIWGIARLPLFRCWSHLWQRPISCRILDRTSSSMHYRQSGRWYEHRNPPSSHPLSVARFCFLH